MNSSSSSSVFFPTIKLSDEEFNLFHNIDRTLYQTLVHNLHREPNESMQVMALWLWLEHEGRQNGKLVSTLLKWPESLVNAIADETVMCLNCIESDNFPYPLEINHDLQLLQNITNFEISLSFFHENRISVLRGVTKISNTVCLRAFSDIWPQAVLHRVARSENLGRNNLAGNVDNVELPRTFRAMRIVNPALNNYHNNPRGPGGVRRHQMQGGGVGGGGGIHRHQLEVIDEEEEVQPDDRTIFLTFSKGYPISENEVRDFFTRKCGNCIEGIFMQEVGATEQPLFARLVIHPSRKIADVLDGRPKAKFSINGKHVWARKYVPRNPIRSPNQPDSPMTTN